MGRNRSEFLLWRFAAGRLLVILLLGWLTILWFQGCLVPLTRDEIRREQEKVSGTEAPPR
jgi:hypothetical protein